MKCKLYECPDVLQRYCSQRGCRNGRGSSCIRQRSGLVRDRAAPRRYTASLVSGNSAKIMGIPTSWLKVGSRILFKMASEYRCNTENYVPIVVTGFSSGASSSSSPSSSSTSSPQDSLTTSPVKKTSTQERCSVAS